MMIMMKKPKKYTYLYKSYRFRLLPKFYRYKLIWKDKFGTPRCDCEPGYEFSWLWFTLLRRIGDDQYWEQWLWINHYNDGNEQKAKETWGWTDCVTGQSTWKEY